MGKGLTRTSSAAWRSPKRGAMPKRAAKKLARVGCSAWLDLLRDQSEPPRDPRTVLVFIGGVWRWDLASFFEGNWTCYEWEGKYPVLWWVNLPVVMLSEDPCTPKQYERTRALIECGLIDVLTRRSTGWRNARFRSRPGCQHDSSRLHAVRKHDLRQCFATSSSCGRVCLDL